MALPPVSMDSSAVTALLGAWRAGQSEAFDLLLPELYDELRRVARRQLARERPGHTLEPTALVHEACLRLPAFRRVDWRGRSHFLALAATLMRRILISHARRHRAAKRSRETITLTEGLASSARPEVDLLDLNDALERLESLSARQAQVVELRYFGGMTVPETAAALAVSPATVKVDWSLAKAFLARELGAP